MNVDEDGDGTADYDHSSADSSRHRRPAALPVDHRRASEDLFTHRTNRGRLHLHPAVHRTHRRHADAHAERGTADPDGRHRIHRTGERFRASADARGSPPNTPVLPLWDFRRRHSRACTLRPSTPTVLREPMSFAYGSRTFATASTCDLRQSILVRGSADAAPIDPKRPRRKTPRPSPAGHRESWDSSSRFFCFSLSPPPSVALRRLRSLKLAREIPRRPPRGSRQENDHRQGGNGDRSDESARNRGGSAQKPAPPPAPAPAKETAAPTPSPAPVLRYLHTRLAEPDSEEGRTCTSSHTCTETRCSCPDPPTKACRPAPDPTGSLLQFRLRK